ncbi:MAG: EndoU domain-containing protein, partial [Mycobacterium sp.]|nr:EndoU domain-containing protein [Mycobacterium sp.]
GGLAAETVVTGYDADDLQRPTRLTSNLSSSYVTNTNYSPTGRPQQYELSTGGAKASLTYNYEYGTQRLHEARTDRENIAGVDRDAVYGYDDAGNVTSITDTSRAGTDTQCFRYDYLRRLSDAWAQNGGTCPTDPATATLGGPAPYRTSYTYTAAGNRKTETQYAVNGSVAATRSYGYAGDPGVDPAIKGHQLGTITQTGASPHSETYAYDAAGNTAKHVNAGVTQTFGYDLEGHLTSVQAGTGTSYLYDADGNRLLRRDSTGTTLYMPGTELRLDKASGAVTCTRYYTHNGSVVAMRTNSGVQFLAADQHGTAEEQINAASQALTQRRFTPFGQPRGTSSGTWTGEKGFVGGTIDPTGLTHLGAREYDPATGRFTAVDSLFDQADPQSWNGYAYADNNPATLSDADGESIPCDGGCPDGVEGDEPAPACAVGDCNDVPGYVADRPGHGVGGTSVFTGNWPNVVGMQRPVNPAVHMNLFHQSITAPDWSIFSNAWYAAEKRYHHKFPQYSLPDFGCDVTSLECEYGLGQIFLRGVFLDMVCAGPGISCGGAEGKLFTAIAAAGAAGLIGPEGRGGANAFKPVNLPSWKRVGIDMGHILDRHTEGGKVYQQSGIKTKFPDVMSPGEIESTIREAYRYSSMAGPSQGPRVVLRGGANGLQVEMWVNRETGVIESAYPVWD